MNNRMKSNRILERGNYSKYSGDFRCLACQNLVSGLSVISGVHHRNHCPYCLWSRCLDLYAPGDRLSACKAAMQPVGLTLKRANKKYEAQKSGELMLVHRCNECGKLSLNRLAADDDPETVLETFKASLVLDEHTRAALAENDIRTLQMSDFHILRLRLFGRN